jgi:predicted RNA-binding Zn-ribbon protein involved in translation (DUF1610 family)
MAAEAGNSVDILLLCTSQEMGESFIQAVSGSPSATGQVDINQQPVQMSVLAGDPRVNPAWDETIRKARGLLMLVRFMDVISMDKVKAIFRQLPNEQPAPLVVVLFREEGESDFKISCPACGQKLWVRDSDVGKRGRCPNCKRAFRLPGQDEHLKTQLLLPDAVPVVTVDRSNRNSCRGAVGKLVERLTGDIVPPEESFDPNVLKQTTMRIQVSPGDTTT